MIKYIFILLMTVFGMPALAQSIHSSVPPECRLLPEHKPDADVTYRPGLDIKGRAVVPADINSHAAPLAERTIVVPLTVDLADRLQGLGSPGLQIEGSLGYLEIHPDGRVSHDGQDWTSQVYVLCGKSAVSSGGQDAGNVINSPVNHTKPTQENHEPAGTKAAD